MLSPWGCNGRVGDPVAFSGAGVDAQDAALPPTALSWALLLHHCPADCHVHPVESWSGTAGTTFVTPHHEYPSYLELRLTGLPTRAGCSDTQGACGSTRAPPRSGWTPLRPGCHLTFDGVPATTPSTRTVIEQSAHTINPPSPQISRDYTLSFYCLTQARAPTRSPSTGTPPSRSSIVTGGIGREGRRSPKLGRMECPDEDQGMGLRRPWWTF